MSSYKQLSNQGTLLLGAGASKSSDKRRPISTVISTGHSHRCSPLPNRGQQWAEQQAPISCYCFVCKQSLNFVTLRRALVGVCTSYMLLLERYTVTFGGMKLKTLHMMSAALKENKYKEAEIKVAVRNTDLKCILPKGCTCELSAPLRSQCQTKQ